MSARKNQDIHIEIIDFKPTYASRFRDLNYEWLNEYFEVEPFDEIVLMNPQKEILGRGGYIIFARVGLKIVGTCALLRHTENRYELAKMAVTQEYRGQGIGRRLAEAAIDRVRRLKADSLVLATSKLLEPANALYESLGFRYVPLQEIGPIPYQRHTVAMELVLKP